jgi:phosphatidylglycerophosphatase C
MTDQSAPVIAAFDLDGTLTQGGSVFSWLQAVAGRGRAWAAGARLVVPLAIGAIRSSRYADNAKERLFHALLAGRSLDQVTRLSREFALSHLAREARLEVVNRLMWHREQGHDVIIVSASPQIYVDVITESLGAHAGLGTRLAVDAREALTGSYLGKNCRGTEKMRRLREWIDAHAYDREPVIYAYGNSRGDRRLLAMATFSYDCGRLGRWGALRKYPRFSSLGPQA